MAYRIHASDRTAFKCCRRQWDLSSPNRQNFEPISGPGSIDLNRALRDALAVYYFPGMWEWDRAIVQPLVHQALERSVRSQSKTAADGGVDEQAQQAALVTGHAVLDAYATWAPAVDNFTPIRVETDFEVNVLDPAVPGATLLTPGGEEIRYCDRVDLLAIDSDDAYWVVQHRLAADGWADHDDLQLDERTIAWCWAWPLFYLGMQITGTVYNEIRADAGGREPDELATMVPRQVGPQQLGHRRMYARSGTVPGERLQVEGTDVFRRTRIRRAESELAVAGACLAAEARTATSPGLDLYPNPEPAVCARCSYVSPCLALNQGDDATAELARSYRQRSPESVQEGRLGGVTWSMNRGAAPPRWTLNS
ncbi:MAG: hypothetical protein M3143_02050 [Actinomycetota bacterium]|nr:hypothetical protein [Actinomycetota bacterium]